MPLTKHQKQDTSGRNPKAWRRLVQGVFSGSASVKERQPAISISRPSDVQHVLNARVLREWSSDVLDSLDAQEVDVFELEDGRTIVVGPGIAALPTSTTSVGAFSTRRNEPQRYDMNEDGSVYREVSPPRANYLRPPRVDAQPSSRPQSPMDVDLNSRFRWLPEDNRPKWYRLDDGCEHTRLENSDNYLCATCRRIDMFVILNQPEVDSIPPLTEFIVLGPLQAIIQKRACGFCRLVMRMWSLEILKVLPANASGAEVEKNFVDSLIADSNDIYYLYPVRFKSEYGVPALHLARNIWNGQRQSVVLSGSNNILPARNLAIRPVHRSQRRLGRLVVKDRIDTEWIRTRLALCDERSAGPPRGVRGTLRAIDVNAMCIVDLEYGARYVTLSYVWGKTSSMRLTRETERELYEPGGLLRFIDLIPRTIRDSMRLVREIGEEHLWVDALCIIQDDEHDLDSQISKMGEIYGQSTLSIQACCGEDASYGLPGIEPGGRQIKQVCEVVGHTVLSNMLPGEELSQKSVWGTRAWTLQEKFLAQRKLIVTDEVMHFWCWHTCSPEDEIDAHESWPTGTRHRQMIFFNDDHDRVVSRRGAMCNLDLFAFIISDYTQRNLSHQEDAEKACRGILNKLAGYFRGRFNHGLPNTEMEDALLWCPVGPSIRRINVSTGEPLFPSWSWLGWIGHAAYPWLVERRFPPSGLNSPLLWKTIDTSVHCYSGQDYRLSSQIGKQFPYSGWERLAQDPWCFQEEGASADAGFPFLHPIEHASRSDRLWHSLDDSASKQLRFQTLSAMFELGNTIKQRKQNYNYEHKVFQLQVLSSAGYSAGYIYVPDPDSMSYQQRTAFTGRQEFIIVSRASLHSDPRVGTDFLEEDLVQSSLCMTMPSSAYGSTRWDRRDETADGSSLDPDAYFDNRVYYKTNPWCLFNVLMIERDRYGIAYRLSVGRIHVGAFMAEDPASVDVVLE